MYKDKFENISEYLASDLRLINLALKDKEKSESENKEVSYSEEPQEHTHSSAQLL